MDNLQKFVRTQGAVAAQPTLMRPLTLSEMNLQVGLEFCSGRQETLGIDRAVVDADVIPA